MYDVEPIKQYITMLKEKFSLSVSLHAKNRSAALLTRELSEFNIHACSYCALLKTNPKSAKQCILNQKKAIKKAEHGPYVGVCYAGVKEAVFPIEGDGEVIGIVSVSGYKDSSPEDKMRCINQEYGIQMDLLKRAYATLKNSPPDEKELKTLITPLCQMLKLALMLGNFDEDIPVALKNALEYVGKHKNEDIKTVDVCSAVGICRATLSSLFKKHIRKTFTDYLTELRIQDSVELLLHSNLSVTEISYTVGYGDSNYFSVLFKKKTGYTPLEYKKYQKQNKKELVK